MGKLFVLAGISLALSCSHKAAETCTGSDGSCGASDADTDGAGSSDASSGSGSDAGVDSGPLDVTLSESMSSDMTGSAASCAAYTPCPISMTDTTFPAGIAWYREFSLADFAGAPWNVTGPFTITNVHFGCWKAAGSASVTITAYNYDGALFGSALDQSDLEQLGTATIAIGSASAIACGSDVDVPLTTLPIAAGSAFVIEIAATDTILDAGGVCSVEAAFRLGANGSGEIRESFAKNYCSGSAAGAWSMNDALISVEGTTN